MRSRIDADIADLQASDLAHTEPPAAREADEDQIGPGVPGLQGLGLQISEDDGEFAAGENLHAVDADRGVVHLPGSEVG